MLAVRVYHMDFCLKAVIAYRNKEHYFREDRGRVS